MAGVMQALATWPEAFEHYLLRHVLEVDPGRVRLPRSLEVGLVWEKGRVRGTVELPGGRFLVTLRVKPLADRAWKWAIEQLVRRPEANQAILAGRLDPAVVQAFAEANASLFVGATRRVECTCKGERDCRHRLAVVAQMVAEAAENPFLWFSVLGRERETFLAALRVSLMEELPDGEEGALSRERFWAVPVSERQSGASQAVLTPPAVQSPQTAQTLVEQLGPFPLVDGPMLVAGRTGRISEGQPPAALNSQGPRRLPLVSYRSLTEFLQLYARQVAEGAKALQVDALVIPEAPPPEPLAPARQPPPKPKARKRRYGRRYR